MCLSSPKAHALDKTYRNAVSAISIKFDESVFGLAAKQREPISIPDLTEGPDYPLKDITLAAGFKSILVVPLIGQDETLGALVLQRSESQGFHGKYYRAHSDRCRPVGARNEQRAAVSRSRAKGA